MKITYLEQEAIRLQVDFSTQALSVLFFYSSCVRVARFSSFLAQSKGMRIRLTGNSKCEWLFVSLCVSAITDCQLVRVVTPPSLRESWDGLQKPPDPECRMSSDGKWKGGF